MSSASSTPSIRVYESHRYSLPHHRRPDHPSPAVAMAIPRAREHIPPPLPPPRHIEDLNAGQDPGWHWGNQVHGPNDTGFSATRLTRVPLGSSLYGQSPVVAHPRSRQPSADHIFKPREHSISHSPEGPSMNSDHSVDHNISDEDHSGKSRHRSLRNPRFQSEQNIQQALQNSSQAYDKQLLSKIGGPNTPTRSSAPSHVSNGSDLTDTHPSLHKLNGQLKPISVPGRLNPSLDSPGPKWPPSGAISPGFSGFRSPVFDSTSLDSHRGRFGSISTPGPSDEASFQHRGSYDHSIFSDHEFNMEENGMRDLNISDRSPAESEDYHLGPKGGLKRRASSPPSEAAREDRPTTSGHTDLAKRRSAQMLVNRSSAASRFQPNAGSLSSTSSLGQRTGSIGSSFGFSTAASSMTSYNGDQRLSPNALSPLGEPDSGPVSPYAASRSLDPSPRCSLSRPQHQRGPPENDQPQIRKMSTDSILHPRHNSVVSRIPGAYICECCPKKPKKFDSEEDLRIHELEKQYICQYCPNRFKNKNEAERHQNSLHLRRHSWSCAALAGAGVHAAFHPSPNRPTAADICGYCGEEFPNPADWEARSEHLNHVHKFGECNQAKKFFRADHFRQHLKHSHAGTSGKWTNMLENACMRDEPPPQERVGSISSLSSHASGPLAPKPGVIDEVHDES